MWLTCLTIGLIFFLLNDLLGLLNGGGLFSAIAAIGSVHAQQPSIDIGQAGLRTPMIVLSAFATTTLAMLLRLDVARQRTQFLYMLGIIGGGFALDAIGGRWIIDRYLGESGYRRCSTLDHQQGSGRGRVWFAHYVSPATPCPDAAASDHR